MKNWFDAILEHLYEAYPLNSSMVEINTFLLTSLGIKEDDRIDAVLLRKTLKELKEKGLITWGFNPKESNASAFADDGSMSPFGMGDEVEHMRTTTLKYHTILVQLSLSGASYIYERKRQQRQDELIEHQAQSILETNRSVQETNASTLQNFIVQKRLTISSIIVSLAAVLISCVALLKENKNDSASLLKVQEKQLNLTDSIHQSLKSKRQTITLLQKDTSIHYRLLPKKSSN